MIGTGIGLGLSGFRVNPPGALATLDLNFASSLSLTSTSGITPSFSRASTGTYFNSSGVLTSAAVNDPRFDHVYDGTNWISKGLLIEEQRTNLCTFSSNQLNAAWAAFNSTIAASSETDPAGGTNAFRIAETTTSNQRHLVYNTITPSASTFTYSVFAKAQERSWLQLIAYDSPNLYYTWFNLSTGVVGTNAAGNTATITAVGNGWYRCSVTRTVSSTVDQYFQAGPANSDNNTAYVGDPTKGLLIYGAQVEIGAFPTSYIPTTTAAVTRSADVCQITGGDFSGFYNAIEGSVCFEGDSSGPTTAFDNYFLICSDGATFNNAAPFIFSSGTLSSLRHRIRAGGSDIFNITTSEQLARNTPIKLAQGYKSGDSVILANGSIIDSRNNSFSTSSISTFFIGHAHSGSAQINGHISRLRYYNTRLTNSQLQGLTL
jgi:hypothetical protein